MIASKSTNALLHGTLDALILKTLARGPRHGYAVARFIEEETGEALLVEEGSTPRRAKLYRLTNEGRRQLAAETETWRRFSVAVSRVLLAK